MVLGIVRHGKLGAPNVSWVFAQYEVDFVVEDRPNARNDFVTNKHIREALHHQNMQPGDSIGRVMFIIQPNRRKAILSYRGDSRLPKGIGMNHIIVEKAVSLLRHDHPEIEWLLRKGKEYPIHSYLAQLRYQIEYDGFRHTGSHRLTKLERVMIKRKIRKRKVFRRRVPL